MKYFRIYKFSAIALMLLLSYSIVNAQGGNQFDKPNNDKPNRQELLAEILGLSQEQIIQIQLIRREQAPLLRDANIRQQKARIELDKVIYADTFDETAVQSSLKEFLEAQAEVTRIRLMNELAVRRVLTPEQLERFRTMRQNIKNRKDSLNNRRQERRQKQNKRNNLPNL